MTQQSLDKETEVNVFARFFGALLVNLKNHNLRLKQQNRSEPPYKRDPNITLVRYR
jgi:hypothetical protein